MNKQRFFGVTALFFTIIFQASAQTNYQAGLTAGVNYSSLRSDLFTTASGRPGLAAGFSLALGFGDRFELNPEIVFTQKGASAKAVSFQPEERIENFTYDYFYNTFEAGLFAGYQFLQNVPIRLQAGGFFGSHFTTARQRTGGKSLWVGNYENVNKAILAEKLERAFAGVDYGPAFGVSAGSGRLRLNLRYYLGLRNLYNNLEFMEKGHSIRTGSLRVTLTGYLK